MNLEKIKNEPLVLIGLILSIATSAVATLLGAGFVSDVAAGRATDILTSAGQLVVAFGPFIGAVIGRNFVYGPKTVEKIESDIAAGDGV